MVREFAQIIGTLELLETRDRERIRGIIINRFRGERALFEDGIRYLETRTGLPVLGLIPHFSDIQIDAEDGLPDTVQADPGEDRDPARVRIGVILLPRISNFTDFAPLAENGKVKLHYLRRPRGLEGWSQRISEHARKGGRIAGICGGYQMLGLTVSDSTGVEGRPGVTEGLGLLPVDTVLEPEKQLHRVSGVWKASGAPVAGYEIHQGVTSKRAEEAWAPIRLLTRNGVVTRDEDGCQSRDGKVWGTYLHGVFDSPQFRAALFQEIAGGKLVPTVGGSRSSFDCRQQQYDLLADHFRRHLDMAKLERLVFFGPE